MTLKVVTRKKGEDHGSDVLSVKSTSVGYFLTAVNERIGAGFVGAFEDDKVSEILKLPRYVRPIGIITLGHPKETEPVERLERIAIENPIHHEKW